MKIKARALPSGTKVYRAVYVDPDTEREVYVTLDPAELPNADTRRRWAAAKSKMLARRRMELEAGATPIRPMLLADIIAKYFEAHTQLRERTRTIYRTATNKLEAWARRAGVKTSADLTRARLLGFRDHLVRAPKRSPAKKGKRGAFAPGVATRSASAVNQDLRATRTVLGYLHDLDLLPRLTFDDLRRGLKMVKGAREAPDFLSSAECAQLLASALAHDAERFKVTRDENAGRRPLGSTPRYESIAPFVATVLLTGMRLGEALALRWSYVDLETLDPDGRKVGEIRLPAKATKTKQARTIGLDVCPALRDVLAELRERADGGGVFVFGGSSPMPKTLAEASRKRLIASYGAPPRFTWQLLRSTCATVSCNAPSLWGTAAPFVSAKRLGHSVAVSEARYAGQLSVRRDARTLEACMSIENEMLALQNTISHLNETEQGAVSRTFASQTRVAAGVGG